MIMEIYHTCYESSANLCDKWLNKKKFICNAIINGTLFADFFIFYLSFPVLTTRFGRIPRASKLFL